MNKLRLILFLFTSGLIVAGCGGNSKKEAEETTTTEEETVEKLGTDADLKEGQRVFFVNLEDGAEVTSPFQVVMGVEGMEVEPAGELSLYKGHHHILINKEYIEKGVVVPADSTHIHYGLGQTETELSLEPGKYVISLQFADGFHRAYGQQMSSSINVVVIEEK